MLKNDKVLTQRVGSGWGSLYGFCAFTVELKVTKKIRRLINNRDQPPLSSDNYVMETRWAWHKQSRCALIRIAKNQKST